MLLDLSFSEIQEYAMKIGLPKFRGEQIFDAMYSGKSLEEITNLSKALKEIIKEDYPDIKILKKLESKDGTKKYIIGFADGEVVECVLMSYKYGYTVCLSTQVGCRMGCRFCASTLNGLKRNLSAGEIIGQVLAINRDLGGSSKDRKITNIVLMGSGEPLDNFDNVCKFIELVSSSRGLNISQRNISLSTCGLIDKINMLADKNYNITLTISLHATTDEKRKEIMPIANRYTIKEIVDACKDYFNKTGRRIYFEYTLIKGVNCHVNIIPLNSVKERNLIGTTRLYAYKFAESLNAKKISATVRRTMGEDIEGACGQLRNKFLKVNN